MLFSAVVISQENKFSKDLTGSFFELIQDYDKFQFHTIHVLSADKAIDFIVQLNEGVSSEEVAQEFGELAKEFKENYNDSHEDKVDIIIQEHNDARKNKKLFIFDMDSTLITQEVIELIASYANVQEKVKEITDAAMRGELDFNQSLAQRVALLKGIESSKLWDELKEKLIITNGAPELTKGLKKMGVTLGVLSGGFLPLATHLKEQLRLDYAFANNLKVEIDPVSKKEVLSGETYGEIVNGDKKAELLQRIAKENSIDVKDAVAVGDGANDLKMMGVAGWGIAWNAKPKVQLEAQSALNSNSLKDIFYILGFSDPEIDDLLE